MLEVKRKDNESFESLIRRFTKKTIQSGKLIQAKKVRYYKRLLSKTALKAKALRREETQKNREYLRKIGKLDEFLESQKKGFKKKR